MRAIVTGGAGFIGSHLVERLVADGWDVLSIDKATGPSIQEYEVIPTADAVFHLASPVGPLGVLSWAGKLVPEVVTTTEIVAAWAKANACPLVYVSTSEVYGSGADDSETDPCTFQAETSARKEYAVAKLAAETMLRNRRGLDVRIVRPFNVAGPRQQAAGGFVIPRFIDAALIGSRLTVYKPGTQMRAFAHVADIVDGLTAAFERGKSGEVYNLGNPDNACTITELAHEVIAETGSSSTVEIIDPVALYGKAFHEAPDKLPVVWKAGWELGWRPTRTRQDIIRDALASVRESVAA